MNDCRWRIYRFALDSNLPNYKHEIQSLIPIIVMTFYYAFGLSVAYTQYRVGLIIFASIGMVLFVVVSLIFSYLILAITALGVGFGATNQSYELITFIIIIFAVMATIAILTLKLSFELAKFIKTYTYSQV
ncbi:hypothetical protein I4U23_014888 [Adineta vaga]|nr:hypothetical protein I4U23_014888 [Adineta vaga]